jgi:hypothetical protein
LIQTLFVAPCYLPVMARSASTVRHIAASGYHEHGTPGPAAANALSTVLPPRYPHTGMVQTIMYGDTSDMPGYDIHDASRPGPTIGSSSTPLSRGHTCSLSTVLPAHFRYGFRTMSDNVLIQDTACTGIPPAWFRTITSDNVLIFA